MSRGIRVNAMRGRVRMPDGESFPGVTITVRMLGGGTTLATTTSDDKGEFSLPQLTDGWYQIETCHEALQSTVVPLLLRHRAGHGVIDLIVHLGA